MSASLPPRPSVEHLKKQAKALLAAFRAGEPGAVAKFSSLSLPPGAPPKLVDAQRLVAREYGFPSWPKLKAHIDAAAADPVNPAEALQKAFHEHDAPALRKVLRRYPELKPVVNQRLFAFDSSAIHHVRSREMLDVLLEAGADINAKSHWWAGGFGILHGADPDLAAYAIERGAAVDAHAAARLGLLDRLREIVDADPALVHARGGDGQTPLHFAATVDVAAFLLDRGADIDAKDVDHESTPAQYMVRDRTAVAKYLVGRGCRTDILLAAALGDLERVRRHLDADPASIRTTVSERYFPKHDPRAGGTIYTWTLGANKTPHRVAREFGHEDVVRLLMERSPDELKLSQALEMGDEEASRALLAAHPGLVRTLAEGEGRKLVDAAQDNNVAAVKLMLAVGWPVAARGQHRGTALHWAAFHGNAAMVREILPYRPPLDDADNEFHSPPLGWATHGSEKGWHRKTGDYPGTVELLCAAGAKLPATPTGTDAVKEVLQRWQAVRTA